MEREDHCACNLRQMDPAAARLLRIQRLKVTPGTLDIHIGRQFGTDDVEKDVERERESERDVIAATWTTRIK